MRVLLAVLLGGCPVAAVLSGPATAQERGRAPLLDIKFDRLPNSAALVAAYNGTGPFNAHLGDYFKGLSTTLGNDWRALTFTLEPDPTFGRVVQMRQIGIDVACPPYCQPNVGASGPTGNLNFDFGRVVNPYWSKRTIRFLPGWTTAGTAYKVFADEYANRKRLFRVVIKNGAAWAPDFHLGGVCTTLWSSRTEAFAANVTSLQLPVVRGSRDDGWWEVVTYYHAKSPREVVAGFWVKRVTEDRRYGWLGRCTGGPYQEGIISFRSGENMNAGVVKTQWLQWGPLQVYDGAQVSDPWGLLGAR